MHLEIDPEMSAYGFFQVAFASLDTRLSWSVVELLRCKNTALAFEVVRRMSFSHRLQILQKAVKAVKEVGGDSPLPPEAEELGKACNLASDLSQWRNRRIHGKVKFLENHPVLVDETGTPLRITVQTCEEKIRDAIHAAVNMEASIPHLVARDMDLLDLMDESSGETS